MADANVLERASGGAALGMSMKRTILAATLLLAACATTGTTPAAVAPVANAVQAAPAGLPPGDNASLNPADAPAGDYTLDPRHASVTWRIRHLGLGIYTARFDTISGTLNYDPQAPQNSTINVTIAANSVSTGLVDQQGRRAFDNEIAENVLDAGEHPNITFVSRSIEVTGPTTGRIAGDLTLRGQTHPVTLDATFEGGRFVQFFGKHVIAFSARTIIDRSQWGANFANPLANGAAGNQVEILIAAEFRKD
jgi:polyisoprenoid-binding protein YceI